MFAVVQTGLTTPVTSPSHPVRLFRNGLIESYREAAIPVGAGRPR